MKKKAVLSSARTVHTAFHPAVFLYSTTQIPASLSEVDVPQVFEVRNARLNDRICLHVSLAQLLQRLGSILTEFLYLARCAAVVHLNQCSSATEIVHDGYGRLEFHQTGEGTSHVL